MIASLAVWLALVVITTALIVAINGSFGTPPGRAYARRTLAPAAHPRTHLIVTTIGFAVAGAFLALNVVAANAYASDPSCSNIRDVSPRSAGACRSQSVRILGTHVAYASRGGRRYQIRIAFFDGHRSTIVLESSDDRVWTAARDGLVTEAVVQTFRGDIVAIATASDVAPTNRSPSVHTAFLALVTAIFGVLAFVSFLRVRRARA